MPFDDSGPTGTGIVAESVEQWMETNAPYDPFQRKKKRFAALKTLLSFASHFDAAAPSSKKPPAGIPHEHQSHGGTYTPHSYQVGSIYGPTYYQVRYPLPVHSQAHRVKTSLSSCSYSYDH